MTKTGARWFGILLLSLVAVACLRSLWTARAAALRASMIARIETITGLNLPRAAELKRYHLRRGDMSGPTLAQFLIRVPPEVSLAAGDLDGWVADDWGVGGTRPIYTAWAFAEASTSIRHERVMYSGPGSNATHPRATPRVLVWRADDGQYLWFFLDDQWFDLK